MNDFEISVVICTYNGWSKGYLADAIQSVFAQTFQPAEIILVDDGSTDGTSEHVRSHFPQVIIINQTNSGISAARNNGIKSAKFEWIALLDDDDIWQPRKLELQCVQIKSSIRPLNTIFASRMAVFSGIKKGFRPLRAPDEYTKWLSSLISCPVTGPSGVIISKTLFSETGPFNENISIGEDFEFWARATKNGSAIIYSVDVLLHYRTHPSQATAPQKKLQTLLKTEEAVLPLTMTLPESSSNLIRWLRILIGVRTLCKNGNFDDAITFYQKISKPNPKALFIAVFLIGLDTFVKIFKSSFTLRLNSDVLKYFLKNRRKALRVFLMGGLGNQMFQFAAGYSVAKKINRRLILDASFYDLPSPTGAIRKFELNKFQLPPEIEIESFGVTFFRFLDETAKISSPKLRSFFGILYQNVAYEVAPPINQLSYMLGYFQHASFFQGQEARLREIFAKLKSVSSSAQLLIERIKSSKIPVCVHVRRGDYVLNKDCQAFHGTPSLTFYTDSMEKIRSGSDPTDAYFFIFSDDIDWCKKNLSSFSNTEYVSSTELDSAETIIAMSHCKHFIISNSTFSWWGAFIGKKQGSIAVMPELWTREVRTEDTGLQLN